MRLSALPALPAPVSEKRRSRCDYESYHPAPATMNLGAASFMAARVTATTITVSQPADGDHR